MQFLHTHVDTKHGSFEVLPDTDQVVPIHYVADERVLRPEGHWTSSALENVLGQPTSYASRTTRLFVVLPELSVDALNIPELVTMLTQYAHAHDLNIKLTYYTYTGPQSSKEYINARNDDPSQKRVSIDIAGAEIISHLSRHRNAAILMLADMHLSPSWDYHANHADGVEFDTKALFDGCNLHWPRNTEYDYNTVVVHTVTDGQCQRVEYAISIPRYR